MLFVLLFVAVLIAVLALTKLFEYHRENIQLKESLEKQRRRTLDYERAMGLNILSETTVDHDLWARSHNGDEFAQRVLESRLDHASEELLSQKN